MRIIVNNVDYSNINLALEAARKQIGSVEIVISGELALSEPIIIDNTFCADKIVLRGENGSINCAKQIENFAIDSDGNFAAPWYGSTRMLFEQRTRKRRASSEQWLTLCGWYHPYNSAYIDGVCCANSQLIISIPSSVKYGVIVDKQELNILTCGNGSTEFVLLQDWVTCHVRISAAYDIGDKVLLALDNSGGELLLTKQWPPKRSKQSFKLDNYVQELNAGMFYYNYILQKVIYKPKKHDIIDNICLQSPVCENAIIIRDCSKLSVQVFDLAINNTGWVHPDKNGLNDLQAVNYMSPNSEGTTSPPSAITIDNADNVEVKNCTLSNCGANGIAINSGSRGSKIIGNKLTDISASAIVVGTAHDEFDANCLNTLISHNIITRAGRDFKGAIGIQVIYSGNVVIKNNSIRDLPYTAISIGWGWCDKKSNTFNISVLGNKINNVCNLMADGAAIYFLGRQDATLVQNNKIKNLQQSEHSFSPSGIYGVYLDEGACFITADNNTFHNCQQNMTYLLDKDNAEFIAANPVYKCSTPIKNSNKTKTAIIRK